MRQRIPILLLVAAALLAGLAGCGKEHGALLESDFPAPLVTRAQLTAPDTVALAWEMAASETVEQWMIYVGLATYVAGYGYVDTLSLADSTEVMGYDYWDTALTWEDEALGDSLYKFTFFRVAPVVNGVEEMWSPRAFPSW